METLLKEIIKKVKSGSIIYTDRWKGYNTLVIYGFKHMRVDKSIRFSNVRVYINGIEGFWSYAKEKLLMYHGIKSMDFRFINKQGVIPILPEGVRVQV